MNKILRYIINLIIGLFGICIGSAAIILLLIGVIGILLFVFASSLFNLIKS
jgi:hypothetical protein